MLASVSLRHCWPLVEFAGQLSPQAAYSGGNDESPSPPSSAPERGVSLCPTFLFSIR